MCGMWTQGVYRHEGRGCIGVQVLLVWECGGGLGAGLLECEGWEVSNAEVWAVGSVWEYGVSRCWGGGVWVFEGRGSRGVVGKVWESGSGLQCVRERKKSQYDIFW